MFAPAAAYEELEAPAAAAVCLLEVDEAAVGVRRVDEPSPPWTCSLAGLLDVARVGKTARPRQAPVGAREAPARVRPGAASTPSRWRSACSWPWRDCWGSARGSSSTESARRAARRHVRTVHLVAAGSARAQLRVSLRAKDSVFKSAKRLGVDFRNCWTPVFLNFAKNSRLGECFRNSWNSYGNHRVRCCRRTERGKRVRRGTTGSARETFECRA